MNEFYGELGDRDARDFAEICREKRFGSECLERLMPKNVILKLV